MHAHAIGFACGTGTCKWPACMQLHAHACSKNRIRFALHNASTITTFRASSIYSLCTSGKPSIGTGFCDTSDPLRKISSVIYKWLIAALIFAEHDEFSEYLGLRGNISRQKMTGAVKAWPEYKYSSVLTLTLTRRSPILIADKFLPTEMTCIQN